MKIMRSAALPEALEMSAFVGCNTPRKSVNT